MPFFDSAGVRIHYQDAGAGEAVVLVHGFASTAEHNWGGTGWIATLSKKYRVIAPDVRGHGLSDEPRSREAYDLRVLTRHSKNAMLETHDKES